MNRDYLLSRLKLLAVVIFISLMIDYFQRETIDAAMVLTKIVRMTVIVAFFTAVEYLWKRRRNA